MPTTMKGPGLFLAQFAGDAAPFNSLASITKWAAGLGYKGVQIPTWDARLFDLEEGGIFQDLLRRGEGHLRRCRRRDHRTVDASAGAVGGGASGL